MCFGGYVSQSYFYALQRSCESIVVLSAKLLFFLPYFAFKIWAVKIVSRINLKSFAYFDSKENDTNTMYDVRQIIKCEKSDM